MDAYEILRKKHPDMRSCGGGHGTMTTAQAVALSSFPCMTFALGTIAVTRPRKKTVHYIEARSGDTWWILDAKGTNINR